MISTKEMPPAAEPYVTDDPKNKIVLSSFLIVLAILSVFTCRGVSYADDVSSEEISTEINLNIENILQDIDFSGLQDVVSDINAFDFFNNGVKDKVQQILNGNYFTNYSSLFSAVISLLVVDVKNYFPFMLKAKAELSDIGPLLGDKKYSLIFGNEATGLSDKFLEVGTPIIIKHSNKIDSLNLPIAVSIALYEVNKK